MNQLYKNLNLISPRIWLIILLFVSFLFRFSRLSNPSIYIFDEVYHVVTAKAYSQNNPKAYNPFAPPPEKNTAYDWLHPPLAKLIQAGSIRLIGNNSLAWRLPSVVFGILSIAAIYYFSLALFNQTKLALLAATLFSLDGLQLTMSRITMNDIFVTTFIILSLTYFYKAIAKDSLPKKHLFFTGLFTGLALATKWSALLLYPIYVIFLIVHWKRFILYKREDRTLLYFLNHLYVLIFLLILPLLIYLLSYSQFFLQGKTLTNFFQLHQQIYYYQTNLTATHGYQSSAWQWPLLIRPVWFHVEYFTNKITNIYNLGNPAIFWGGLAAIVVQVSFLKQNFKTRFFSKTKARFYLLVSYFILFLPWLFSPRILFLHHYLPALSLLCLILAQSIHKSPSISKKFLLLTFILFLFFYPLNTAIPIPKHILNYWFWFPSWK